MKQIPCTNCGRPRPLGGKAKGGVCRLCWHEAHRRVAYFCTEGCGRPVSGPDRSCQPCYGERKRVRSGGSDKAYLTATSAKDRASALPTESWWIVPRDQWSKVLAEQLPRILSVDVKTPKPHQELW